MLYCSYYSMGTINCKKTFAPRSLRKWHFLFSGGLNIMEAYDFT